MKKTKTKKTEKLIKGTHVANVGENITKPIFKVKHSKLKRMSMDSHYRSCCPVCKDGCLLMMRNKNGKLSKNDYCVLCGQGIEYTDIKELNLL